MFRLFSRCISTNKPPKEEKLLSRVLHIRRVARVNSGGKIRTISALVIVGDQNGSAGYGMGRGSDAPTAVQKAQIQAKKNMQFFPRFENRTIFSDMDYKFHRVNFQFRYGVVANNNIHEVCRCIGIQDLSCKVIGSQNPMNVIKGAFEALSAQKRPEDIAKMRGKNVFDVEMNYYGKRFTK